MQWYPPSFPRLQVHVCWHVISEIKNTYALMFKSLILTIYGTRPCGKEMNTQKQYIYSRIISSRYYHQLSNSTDLCWNIQVKIYVWNIWKWLQSAYCFLHLNVHLQYVHHNYIMLCNKGTWINYVNYLHSGSCPVFTFLPHSFEIRARQGDIATRLIP